MVWMMFIMILPVLGLALFFVLPLAAALPLYLVLLAISGAYHWLMMCAMRLPFQAGPEKMIGSIASVRNWKGNAGQVLWEGQIWRAETSDGTAFASEDRVTIGGLSGLTLFVRPVEQPQVERRSAKRSYRVQTTSEIKERSNSQ
jgi:membrane protein implicated in regulation of membrane protease activity